MKAIETVGIVGFGVMGAAIGLNAAAAGYRVVFKELTKDLVESMYTKGVVDSLAKRVAKGKLSQVEADAIAGRIRGTDQFEDLAGCDLVIEAAVEKQDLKIDIFEALSKACPDDTLLVSNTSTFPIETLMQKVTGQQRTAGLHYFFPANINRLVEVIRQKATNDDTYEALLNFAVRNGKVAIRVKDFPGFAINPIFIASYMVLDSFLGESINVATLENLSKEALNVRFGIMWVQNGTGLGTCYHAAVSMNSYLAATEIGYPAVPQHLQQQMQAGRPWPLEDGPVSQNPVVRRRVKDRLLGTIFAMSTHLIEKEVVTLSDLELGMRTALAWPKGPFRMMNELGMQETLRMIQTAAATDHVNIPGTFKDRIPPLWQL